MKKGAQKRVQQAIDRMAKHYEFGSLIADSDPGEFLTMVADDLDRYYNTRVMICPDCAADDELEAYQIEAQVDE
jgi:hypothetical protein